MENKIDEVPPVEKAIYKVNVEKGKQLAIANPEYNFELFSSQIKDLYNKGIKRRKRVGIYAGSFNPIHAGHVHIIFSALDVFDEVEVVIADNPDKKYSVSVGKRMEICKETLINEATNNRIFVNYTRLPIAKFAREFSAKYEANVTLIRGIRNADDLQSEKAMATFNKELNKTFSNTIWFENLNTVFFASEPEFSHLSSSAIRQIAEITTEKEFARTLDYNFDKWDKLVWEAYHNA